MEKEPFEASLDNPETEAEYELSPQELVARLRSVLDVDHVSFLEEAIEHGDDIQEMMGYAYGALLDQGEDPDEIFRELKITADS